MINISKDNFLDTLNLSKDDYIKLLYENGNIINPVKKNSVFNESKAKLTCEKYQETMLNLGIKKGFIWVDCENKCHLISNINGDEFYEILKNIFTSSPNGFIVQKNVIDNIVNWCIDSLWNTQEEDLCKKVQVVISQIKEQDNLIDNSKDCWKNKAECLDDQYKNMLAFFFFYLTVEGKRLNNSKCLSKIIRKWLEKNDEKRKMFFAYFIASRLEYKTVFKDIDEELDIYNDTDADVRRCFYMYDYKMDDKLVSSIRKMIRDTIDDQCVINKMIEKQKRTYEYENYEKGDFIFWHSDDNIDFIRQKYKNGLHFVVGDIHGHYKTLQELMKKIKFDKNKDHIYFVGDYYSSTDGDAEKLMKYMAQYTKPDYNAPGFHMTCGNHEWQLNKLLNLPDIIVVCMNNLHFYIVHASLYEKVYELIEKDIEENIQKNTEKKVFAYQLDREKVGPTENGKTLEGEKCWRMMWSKKGTYNPSSEKFGQNIINNKICIIHGHTPYFFFDNSSLDKSYGKENMFWTKQHIWFSEDMQSFDIDANVKGNEQKGNNKRGLACICLEVFDREDLTIDEIRNGENGVFYVQKVNEGDNIATLETKPDIHNLRINDLKCITIENEEVRFKSNNA